MTTVNLNSEQEAYIREYATLWGGEDPASRGSQILLELAEQLPPAPYVPEVGDLIHAYDKAGDRRTAAKGERVCAIDADGFVICEFPEDDGAAYRTACMYHKDHFRFEKVEQ